MSRSEYNVSRRDLLKLTSAGLLGTSMSGWFGSLASHAAAQEKRPKSCILLWMNGGASQFETFDMKPGARTGGCFGRSARTWRGLKFAS